MDWLEKEKQGKEGQQFGDLFHCRLGLTVECSSCAAAAPFLCPLKVSYLFFFLCFQLLGWLCLLHICITAT